MNKQMENGQTDRSTDKRHRNMDRTEFIRPFLRARGLKRIIEIIIGVFVGVILIIKNNETFTTFKLTQK